MLLIPIGRDDAEIRRHAWVSYTIIALNALVFVLTIVATRPSVLENLENTWEGAYVYYIQHPYLKPPPELKELLPDDVVTKIQARMQGPQRPPQTVIEREQKQLDEMVARAVAERQNLPNQRYGYVPARPSAYKLITSMFLHGGILHLLGNLLFFYLSGPFVEDVFGRPLFAVLYFVGGVVAALTFAARDPQGIIPLVGASGAISAVMGAYLFRFYRSNIELLFVPFIWRPMLHWRFFVPAFIVLPLWFGEQLLEMRSEAGSGVAFSAHVGGFVFGFLFAGVLGLTGFEQKFVDPRVKKQTTWAMDDRLARAIAARQRGDDTVAKKELASVLRDEPRNIDALRTVLDMAEAEDDWSTGDGIAARLLNAYVEEKLFDTAKDLIGDVTANREARLPKFLARAAPFVERTGDRDWALMLYERLYDADPVGPGAVGTLVRTSALLRASGEPSKAREMLQKARAHPACNSEWARTIESKLQGV